MRKGVKIVFLKGEQFLKNILTVIARLLIANFIQIPTDSPAVEAAGRACGLECGRMRCKS